MIHISKLNMITERKDGNGKRVPFSFKAITMKGEIITGEECVVTSSNSARKTRNILFTKSGQIRKLHNLSFIEINGIEITM